MAMEFALNHEEESNSWKRGNKEILKEILTISMKNQIFARLSQLESGLQNDIDAISILKNQLNDRYDKMKQKMRIIANEKKFLASAQLDLSNELDLISQHEKVVDVHVEGSFVVVYTKPIYLFDSDDSRYYLGNCSFKIEMQNSTVFFDNDNRRHGYWSENDVHPHISSVGEPCWGTIATTIIELCSQLQLYAITLMCLDFLEQANLDDPAGQYVVMWDKVDDDGKVIEVGGTYGLPNHSRCPQCNNWIHEEDMYVAFNEVDVTVSEDEEGNEVRVYGSLSGEHTVCLPCRESDYDFIEPLEEWVYRNI